MELIVVILILLSGICKGIQDQTMFHWGLSWTKYLKGLFWNPLISWKNKYKNGDPKQGPKFWGSTTFLVGVTDAWHLFGGIGRILDRTIVVLVYASLTDFKWYIYVLIWIGLFIFYTIGFKLFYHKSTPNEK
jgi:hypothetical protein